MGFTRQPAAHLAFLSLLLTVLGDIPQAGAIRKGIKDDTDPTKYTPNVYMVDYGRPGGARGTAFASKYPRCIISAAHILSDVKDKGMPYIEKHDKSGRVKFADIDTSSSMMQDKWEYGMRDLAVLWTKERNVANFMKDADYVPTELKKDLALTEAFAKETDVVDANQNKIGSSWSYTLPPGKAVSAFKPTIVGYGATRTAKLGNDLFNTGDGRLHYAESNLDILVIGKNQNPARDGAMYVDLQPLDPNKTQVCGGDSGGPAFDGAAPAGQAFGVASASTAPVIGNYCKDSEQQQHTALHTAARMAAGAQPSNWAWLEDQIEKCGKKMMGEKKDGKGGVGGAITPPQIKPYEEMGLNGAIDTFSLDRDQWEIVHAGQTLTLTAYPQDDDVFKAWSGTNCPCSGSTDPVCVVPYASIGLYTETESIDTSTCLASFGPLLDPIANNVDVALTETILVGEVGSNLSFQATVTNNKAYPIGVTGYTISGSFGINVLSTTTNCPSNLAPSQSCEVTFLFTPSAPGMPVPHSVRILLADGSEAVAVVLIGAEVPQLAGPAGDVVFAAVTPNTVATQSFTIVNESTSADAALAGLRLGGEAHFLSSLSLGAGTTCEPNAILAPGEDCTVEVDFSPLRGMAQSEAWLMVDQLGQEDLAIKIIGSAVSPGVVHWDNAFVHFGEVPVGSQSLSVAHLVNNSESTLLNLNVYSSIGSGSQPGTLEILASTCGTELEPEAICGVTLSFSSTAPGVLSEGSLVADYIGGSVTAAVNGIAVETVIPTPTVAPTIVSPGAGS